MRKALLYLLLVAYITVIGKPAVPAIADAIAHVFWYSEHMATVHYENGRYHVHHENINEAKKDKAGQDEGLLKNISFFAAHIVNLPAYSFHSFLPQPATYLTVSAGLVKRPVLNELPPPQA